MARRALHLHLFVQMIPHGRNRSATDGVESLDDTKTTQQQRTVNKIENFAGIILSTARTSLTTREVGCDITSMVFFYSVAGGVAAS